MSIDFTLSDDRGGTFTFDAAYRKAHEGALLSFLRGAWCSASREWAQRVIAAKDQFDEVGVDVTFVSADGPLTLAKWRKDQNIPFRMLSDPKHEVADRFGLHVGRNDPRAKSYADGYIQPGHFGFVGQERVYELISVPKLSNLYGARGWPDPEVVCLALAKRIDRAPSFRAI